MNSLESTPMTLGLRERKKQQTRETISAAALKLFAERGYEATTLADIAQAADVSPYFDSKEDILFCDEGLFLEDLRRRLEERPLGMTTVDAIREFLAAIPPPTEEARLRKRIVTASAALEMKMRAQHSELEPLLANAIAKDLGVGPEDIRPLLIAASMTAAFMSVRDRFFEAESGGEPITHEEGLAVLDQVLEFTRAGVEALQRD
jgi:AcrR family transcriptional regulator